MAVGLKKRLIHDFSRFGVALHDLYITSITPPPEVQKAIDDRSRLGTIKDMDKFVKMKAAMAMEKAAQSSSEAGAGLGLGIGMMMPAMFGGMYQTGVKRADHGQEKTVQKIRCGDCGLEINGNARFCPHCGHQQLILGQCANCGKNLPPNAKFCSRCGHPADEKPSALLCSRCQTENLPGALFCNGCGRKLD